MTLRHRYLLGYEPPEGKRGLADDPRRGRPARHHRAARKGYYAGG